MGQATSSALSKYNYVEEKVVEETNDNEEFEYFIRSKKGSDIESDTLVKLFDNPPAVDGRTGQFVFPIDPIFAELMGSAFPLLRILRPLFKPDYLTCIVCKKPVVASRGLHSAFAIFGWHFVHAGESHCRGFRWNFDNSSAHNKLMTIATCLLHTRLMLSSRSCVAMEKSEALQLYLQLLSASLASIRDTDGKEVLVKINDRIEVSPLGEIIVGYDKGEEDTFKIIDFSSTGPTYYRKNARVRMVHIDEILCFTRFRQPKLSIANGQS